MLSVTAFLAFGDSMTAGEIVSEGATRGFRTLVLDLAKSYPTDLRNDLTSYYTAQVSSISVTNQGFSGETAVQGAARLPGVLVRGSFQVLLLMEGANDIANRDPVSMNQALAAIQGMVNTAKGRGVRVLLATLPPENRNGCCPNRGLGADWVVPYNNLLRTIAAAANVPLVDVYQAFGGIPSPDLIDFDGLHPTAAGYQLIADTFFASIKQNLELPVDHRPAVGAAAVRRPLRRR